MSFNLNLSGSTLAFNFIAAAASGTAIIESPTTLIYNAGSAAHFFDDVFFVPAINWRVTGNLPAADISPAAAGPATLAQVRGVLDTPSGNVIATFSGRVKAADGTSSYLTLNFLTTATWGDFFALGKDDVRLSNGSDALNGLAGNDYIRGLGGADTLLGGVGRDTIEGGSGADTIEGNGGNDLLRGGNRGDVITGGTGRDTINGQNGNDAMEGNGGNDFLDGGKGNDLIGGGAGRDTLRGGNGRDTLVLDGGNDRAWGGGGADTFRIVDTDQAKRIVRVNLFKDDVDSIEFATSIFADVDAALDNATPGSNRVSFDMGEDGLLIVYGVSDAELLRDDIGFF